MSVRVSCCRSQARSGGSGWMGGSCWREQGGSTGLVSVQGIAAGQGSMSSMRPGETLLCDVTAKTPIPSGSL